ncbi:Ku protein [Streptomyces sp. bgisy084]|uniref:Ku protein n=1 Tax=unclassified Streptomyces TaxID=2593676 RepID=UPI003D75CD08
MERSRSRRARHAAQPRERPYYLGADPAAAKPYALLRDAMHESGLAAVARVALRSPSPNLGLVCPKPLIRSSLKPNW